MKIVKGKRYKVVSDDDSFFREGEIVVTLDSDCMPYCVRESEYDENMKEPCQYEMCHTLFSCELEEIEGEDYTEDDSKDNLTADIIKHQDELLKYRAIGTLEECMEAVEKQKARKPRDMKREKNGILYGYCPNCDRLEISENIFCSKCGQKLDWGREGEE